jgi:hypothetical protein
MRARERIWWAAVHFGELIAYGIAILSMYALAVC